MPMYGIVPVLVHILETSPKTTSANVADGREIARYMQHAFGDKIRAHIAETE